MIIKLGSGDLYQGFSRVAVQLWTVDNPLPEQFMGSLPPAPELIDYYRTWQWMYRALGSPLAPREIRPIPLRLSEDGLAEYEVAGLTNVSQVQFDELSRQLRVGINTWLKSAGFLSVEYRLRSRLNNADLVRIIVETEDPWLRRLPWHRWEFFRDYPRAEMALSQPEYQRRICTAAAVRKQEVRILAVFGNGRGIDLEMEARLLKRLPSAAVKFLVNPTREEFNAQLWRTEGWDILFFAGHSQTQSGSGRIYINEQPAHNSLTLQQLEEALSAAIDRGLQLAIFNSCDGLGLARDLEKLHIPTVVVMREPVPNRVAQVFFYQFLLAFAHEHLPLYLAFQQARRQLQGLENDFPAASWLPVICQNLAVEPPTWQRLGGTVPCPYRGLFAFQEKDAPLFFGREQFAEELFVAAQTSSLVAVVGPSGSGKSSVVFAGLVPKLRAATDSSHQIFAFRPGDSPFEAMAEAIASVMISIQENVEKAGETDALKKKWAIAFRRNSHALAETIREITCSAESKTPTRLTLIIDQFEELYTLSLTVEQRPFLDALIVALNAVPGFTLVLTLRADFYGQALNYRPFSDLLQGAVCNLGPMSREELRAAIELPAGSASVGLESGLSSRLIDDVWQQAGSLPLLEFALTQLWSKQKNGLLTHQAYSEIGGVEVALANHAESVYERLCGSDKRLAQQVFMQLVHLRDGQAPARRLASRSELKADSWNLVNTLASARLVVTSYNASVAQETVEIVHETLLRSWGRLKRWIQADGDFYRWQQQLRAAKREWERNTRDNGLLLRWKPLSDAEYWYLQRQADLSAGDVLYIQQSLKQRDRETSQRTYKRRLVSLGLMGGLALTLLLAGTAFYQWRQAYIREIEATSRYSGALFATNRRLEATIEAIRARRSLERPGGVDASTRRLVDLALKKAAYGLVEYNRLTTGLDARGIERLAYSANGEMIASIAENNNIQIWDKSGKLRTEILGHETNLNSISFSPDNQMLATAADDKTIKLWTLDGALIKTVKGHRAEVSDVAFSPDGQRMVSAARNGTIRLWRLDGTLLRTMSGHRAEVSDVAFSPDGRTIVSGGDDKTVRLWGVDGTLLKTMSEHQAEVTCVTFRPDGGAIASASKDGTVKLWFADGTLSKTFDGHRAEVTDVAFSPDSRMLVSASADRTVKLWRENGTLLTSLEGHGDIVWRAAFSPDGESIASASWDGTIRLWKYQNPLLSVLSGHEDGITHTAFSPDGRRVATASDDKTVKLWAVDGTLLKTLIGHRSRVYVVAFSPDGKVIASASDDQTIKIWDLEGNLLRTLSGHSGAIWGLAFRPDGGAIASASEDRTIKLWNLEGELLQTFVGHRGKVLRVLFAPDGQTLISTSNDKTIKLWELDGRFRENLTEQNTIGRGVDLSPDGRRLASVSEDGTITTWALEDGSKNIIEVRGNRLEDLEFSPDLDFSPDGQAMAVPLLNGNVQLVGLEGNLLQTLSRHTEETWGVAYSPDGQTLASSSADGTVVLWDLARLLETDELAYACEQVRDYLTHSQEVLAGDRTLCDL